jgi:hypothetical protein
MWHDGEGDVEGGPESGGQAAWRTPRGSKPGKTDGPCLNQWRVAATIG